MLSAGARDAPGDNLSLLGRKLDKPLVVFIVDVDVSILAKPADFSLLYFFYWYQFIYSLIFC